MRLHGNAKSPYPVSPAAQSGFTYLGVLFLVAVIGIVLASVGTLWSAAKQRERERELLFVGGQFRRAIQQYYEHTPGPVKQYPKSLEDLLQDSRHPVTRRFLRKIFTDPMTGKAEWGMVQGPDGRLTGVYSLSEEQPIKTANFREADHAFEGKSTYSEWKFVYAPKPPTVPGAPPSFAVGAGAPEAPRK